MDNESFVRRDVLKGMAAASATPLAILPSFEARRIFTPSG